MPLTDTLQISWWRTLTAALIVMAPGLIILYDLVAKYFGGSDATITRVIQEWTKSLTELPAIAAALFVWLWLHLFLNSIISRAAHFLPHIDK